MQKGCKLRETNITLYLQLFHINCNGEDSPSKRVVGFKKCFQRIDSIFLCLYSLFLMGEIKMCNVYFNIHKKKGKSSSLKFEKHDFFFLYVIAYDRHSWIHCNMHSCCTFSSTVHNGMEHSETVNPVALGTDSIHISSDAPTELLEMKPIVKLKICDPPHISSILN